jgi:hypothetical protein
MYLAAKEGARMIQGEVPEKRMMPAPPCPACAACPTAAQTVPALPSPPAETPSRAAPTSSAAEAREHTRIELDVGPDLVTCLDARELRRLVYELAFEQTLGPPTTNVLRVRARRTPGGYALDIRLEEASGTALYAQHVEYADSYCCYEVLFLAALEGVIMLEAAAREGKGVATCPPCPACTEVPNTPPPPVAVQRRRVRAGRATAPPPALFVKGGISLGLGVAPDAAVGVMAGVGWRFAPRFWIEADVAGTASIPVAGAPSTLAGAWTVSGSLAPCFQIDTRYGVCGMVRGGGMWRTTTEPYHRDAAATPRYVAAGVRGLAEWPLRWSGWALRVEGELGWAFLRPDSDDPRGPIPLGRPWTGHAGLLLLNTF